MISESNYSDPNAALQEIHQQQAMVASAIDTQVCLQLMVQRGLVSQQEIADMRLKVANLPKYKVTLDQLIQEESMMQAAKAHPNEYTSALLRHKVDELFRRSK